MAAMQDHEARLRRLAINDERLLGRAMACRPGDPVSRLDERTLAVTRFAALVAVSGPPVAYASIVSSALGAGVTPDDLVETLVAVAPVVGSVAVVSAAPKLALALGYDLDAELEDLGPGSH